MIILNSVLKRKRTLGSILRPLRTQAIGSVAYKLGLTAAGKADIFASLRPKNEWDICAEIIVNEAGGKLIDLFGKQNL